MASIEHILVGSWHLRFVEQAITSSEGLIITINLRTTRGAQTIDVHCMSLFETLEKNG